MSFVYDQVRRIDSQLDRLQLAALPVEPTSPEETLRARGEPSSRLLQLQAAITSLSPSQTSRNPLLSPREIQQQLSTLSKKPEAAAATQVESHGDADGYETELEWLLVSKAATQIYGLVLNSILDETVALADDVWYWDEVLSSRRYTALYSVQTAPLRFWHWSYTIWSEVKSRGGRFNIRGAGQDATDSLTERWRHFYGLVKQVVRERSVAEVQKQVINPVSRIRAEVRRKQVGLKKARLRGANALGVLLGEGLGNESIHGEGLASPNGPETQHKWKISVARNVALMEAVLAKVNDATVEVDKFDAAVGGITEDDPLFGVEIVSQTGASDSLSVQPQLVAERLSSLLALGLPHYGMTTKAIVQASGKPSRLVRYWLPITVGVLSSSTILRILVSRQAEIVQWIQDFGSTMIDFWSNWVVEPTRKVIKTIRHDEGSEVSIMSKRSLEGDRDSLERMVVDFAIDNPANATDSGSKLTHAEIADVRLKVREGDLTPVLKAYEKDLTSPFMGTVRGNLIRALLIQIQKTKVDVEVAIGGIDSLLKSQELVFGFVGLTPGILVTIAMYQWLRSSLTNRRGGKSAQKQGKMLRQLRNVDRILSNGTPTDYGELFYKDQGLLLCEVHVLRQAAQKLMPDRVYREFTEEVEELVDVRTGVDKQIRVVDRMRWAYARYF